MNTLDGTKQMAEKDKAAMRWAIQQLNLYNKKGE